MKKKIVLVHPCPKCGSIYLAHGKPYGCATPWLVAWLGSLHGVVCTACGHYKPTVIAWNREWRKKMHNEGLLKEAETMTEKSALTRRSENCTT